LVENRQKFDPTHHTLYFLQKRQATFVGQSPYWKFWFTEDITKE